MLMGAPMAMYANHAIEIIDNNFGDISITIKGNVLRVANANGLVLHIYNVAGQHVNNFKVEGNDRSYSLSLPHGCYIVKVGNVVRKISIS